MSTWTEIKDKDDVNYDIIDDTIDVLISTDDFGNNYVSIPLAYIIEALTNEKQ